MASLNLNLNIQTRDSILRDQFQAQNLSISIAAERKSDQVLSATTGGVVVDYGDVVTPGYCILENLDDTNFVDFGPDDTGLVPMGRLLPGEVALFRFDPSADLVLQADTAACDVRVLIYAN